MKLIDTHTHLYLEQFDEDRDDMLHRAMNNGVEKFLLPNIDQHSISAMTALCGKYPQQCFPMLGLHPTSVSKDYPEQLNSIHAAYDEIKPIAIGEIGIDLYWDKSFENAQLDAFNIQMEWAKTWKLPLVIHSREAFPLIIDQVEAAQDGHLTGVFHCFTGTEQDAQRILDLGFYLGIGGVLTYKKSTLPDIVKKFPLSSFLLETDAPFLPPVPYRGKRNESAYLIEVAKKMAEIRHENIDTIAEVTSSNAKKLFKLP